MKNSQFLWCYQVISKAMGNCFKFVWPSQNVWTLTSLIRVRHSIFASSVENRTFCGIWKYIHQSVICRQAWLYVKENLRRHLWTAPIFCCCLSLEESACLAFIGGKTRIAGTKRELFFYFTQLCLLEWAIKEVCSFEAYLFVHIELIKLTKQ